MTVIEYALAFVESTFHTIRMATLKDMSEKDIEALADREAAMCCSCHLEESSRVIFFDWCGRGSAKGLCESCEQELLRELDEIVKGKVRIQ